MDYSLMTETDIALIAALYMDYYNNCEDGCWTQEKAWRRIHQMVTIEDSRCLIQWDHDGNVTGFAIGYFKQYDDCLAYYLEEIVILAAYQGRGLGTAFLKEIERRIRERGAEHLELTSVNDEHHCHFYTRFGMYADANLKVMGKHYSADLD